MLINNYITDFKEYLFVFRPFKLIKKNLYRNLINLTFLSTRIINIILSKILYPMLVTIYIS